MNERKCFIILDLDMTLIEGRSIGSPNHRLFPGMMQHLQALRKRGHHLAICSNNKLAKSIALEVGILSLVDFVVACPSSTCKVAEMQECWEMYRYLHRSKAIKSRIKLSRMVFVDDSGENLTAVGRAFPGLRCFESMARYLKGEQHVQLSTEPSEYRRECPPRRQLAWTGDVHISSAAQHRDRDGSRGNRRMRFHLYSACAATQRIGAIEQRAYADALADGHSLCRLCAYHCSWPSTCPGDDDGTAHIPPAS